MRPIRVLVAEDHYLFREGLRKLLETHDRVEVVATVGDALGALTAVERLHPDVAVVDIRMPPRHETEGLDVARTIRTRHRDVGVVVLSQYANAVYALDLFADGTAGRAYMLKDRVADIDDVVRAIVAVNQGDSLIDPQVVQHLLPRGAGAAPQRSSPVLTERETDVLSLMAEARSNAAIASALHLSLSAVEKHVGAIMAKFDLPADDATINRRVAAVLAYLRSFAPTR